MYSPRDPQRGPKSATDGPEQPERRSQTEGTRHTVIQEPTGLARVKAKARDNPGRPLPHSWGAP